MDEANEFTVKVWIDDDGEDVMEYFDKYGKNVTPLPLHVPDEEEQQFIAKDVNKKGFKKPPKKHTIMKTFLHMTTALYSMAGLGSLEHSTAFMDMTKQYPASLTDEQVDDHGALSKTLQEMNLEDSKQVTAPTGESRPFLKARATSRDDSSLDSKKSSSQQRLDDLPDNMKAVTANQIEVLLTETDTIWMLTLPGTCIEIDPDSNQNESESNANMEQVKQLPKNLSKYQLVDCWTQTLDFSKKKKGTQCDDIETEVASTQVNTKNFLDEEIKQMKELNSVSKGSKSPVFSN